jgi:hypothetical protein
MPPCPKRLPLERSLVSGVANSKHFSRNGYGIPNIHSHTLTHTHSHTLTHTDLQSS